MGISISLCYELYTYYNSDYWLVYLKNIQETQQNGDFLNNFQKTRVGRHIKYWDIQRSVDLSSEMIFEMIS